MRPLSKNITSVFEFIINQINSYNKQCSHILGVNSSWIILNNQPPSKHLLVLKTSSRRFQDMSWRRLQHVFSVTILRLPRHLEDILQRRLEDILQDVFKTSWKMKNCYAADFLKTSWRTSWRRLEDISWRCLEDISWRRLEDMCWRCLKDMFRRRLEDITETNKILTGDICILIWG